MQVCPKCVSSSPSFTLSLAMSSSLDMEGPPDNELLETEYPRLGMFSDGTLQNLPPGNERRH